MITWLLKLWYWRGLKTTVLYKSGNKVHFKAVKFDYKGTGSSLTTVSWMTRGRRTKPLFINVDEIEAIYQGWV